MLEGRGSVDGRIPQRARSAGVHRSLDRRVQLRPATSRRRESYPARSIREFCSCTKKRGPDCLDYWGALHTPTRAMPSRPRAFLIQLSEEVSDFFWYLFACVD